LLAKHELPRPPGCQCGAADVDAEGHVLRVKTCPICLKVVFGFMRGTEYAIAHVKGGDTEGVLLKQKEFFSPKDGYS